MLKHVFLSKKFLISVELHASLIFFSKSSSISFVFTTHCLWCFLHVLQLTSDINFVTSCLTRDSLSVLGNLAMDFSSQFISFSTFSRIFCVLPLGSLDFSALLVGLSDDWTRPYLSLLLTLALEQARFIKTVWSSHWVFKKMNEYFPGVLVQ